MSQIHGVKLNGIDPDGKHPPDEVLHHPDDGPATELVRNGNSWDVRVYSDGELDYTSDYDHFFEAFAYFAEMAGLGMDAL